MELTEYEAHTIKTIGLEMSTQPSYNECPKCNGEGEVGEEEWHATRNIEELYYTCIECGCKWKTITLYRAIATKKIEL